MVVIKEPFLYWISLLFCYYLSQVFFSEKKKLKKNKNKNIYIIMECLKLPLEFSEWIRVPKIQYWILASLSILDFRCDNRKLETFIWLIEGAIIGLYRSGNWSGIVGAERSIKMTDERGVHPDCRNASNPYHECSEYCFKIIAETKARMEQKESGHLAPLMFYCLLHQLN